VVTVSRTVAPEHRLAGPAIDRVGFAMPPGSVVVGRTSTSRPVVLRLFGPRPMRIMFVGGPWAAGVLLLRCLGYGAAVEVDAIDTVGRPAAGTLAPLGQWLSLDRAAGGTGGRVWRMGAGHPEPPATAARPFLRLHDTGLGGAAPAGWGPWRTELAVLPHLTAAAMPAVLDAQLLLVQRLTPPEIMLVSRTIDRPDATLPQLSTMDNGMVAVLDNHTLQIVWLTPTPLERRLLG
jgi:hypothetical protein